MRREVFRQDPPNKSPQHVADYKRPHAAIKLAQGYKASDAETLKYDGRDGGVGKPTGGAIQQAIASSSSSKRMRRCSLVAPEGPAAEPRRALLRPSRKDTSGKGHGWWGQQCSMASARGA